MTSTEHQMESEPRKKCVAGCGASLPPFAKFCGNCGSGQGEASNDGTKIRQIGNETQVPRAASAEAPQSAAPKGGMASSGDATTDKRTAAGWLGGSGWLYLFGGVFVAGLLAVVVVVLAARPTTSPVYLDGVWDHYSSAQRADRCRDLTASSPSGRESYYKGFSLSSGVTLSEVRTFFNDKCGL